MNNDGSVTQWIHDLANGEESVAQQELFSRHFGKLVALARRKVYGAAAIRRFLRETPR